MRRWKSLIYFVILSLLAIMTNVCLAQVVVDGHDSRVKHDFLVDITSVEVRRTSSGPMFVLKGASVFPDGTHVTLDITFKKTQVPNANTYATIKDGKFEVTWEAAKLWPNKKFFPGNYNVKTKVSSSLQSRSIRKLIKKELGAGGNGIHERNMYVTLGTSKEVKKEENRLKEHYVNAIKGLEKLLAELEKKYMQANLKFRRQFSKLDKNGRPQRDPKNISFYFVDEQKFLKHLRDNPNEFYDAKGRFKKDVWRKWLDETWRAQWKKLSDGHRRIRGDYVITAWPKDYDNMAVVLGMLLKLSAEYSIKVYRWNNLALDPKDETGKDSDGTSVPAEPRLIRKMLKEIWLNLRLDKYIESQKEDKSEKKQDGQ